MSGYETYMRYQRIEAQAKELGFRLANPKHGNWGRSDEFGERDVVALYPNESALPVFTRDAEIFSGTFSQVQTFLSGWARAQQYDMMLRLSDSKKRTKAEAREVERQRIAQEKAEQRKMFAILKNKDVTDDKLNPIR
jgi:hypothetical protein